MASTEHQGCTSQVRTTFGPVLPGLIILLAACGGAAAPAPSAPAAPASSPASAAAAKPASAAASAAASATPAASAATGASGAAAAGGIKIGLLQPLTGIYANQGIDHSDGFKLYLESINNQVAGKPIQVIVADDQGQPDVGLTKAKQLVDNDHVQILAGGTVTPECYALAPYARDAQVPFVNTGNCIGYDLLTNPKYASPFTVRVSGPLLAGTDTLADWASKNGYKKGVLMASDYAAGHQIADAFASAFVTRGGQIVQEQYPAQGTTDFGPFLAKLDKSADFVFSFFPGVDGLRMMQAFDQYADPTKVKVLDYGTAIASGPNVAQLKDKAVGIVGGATLYVDTIDSPENQAFVKAWKAKFPQPDRFVDADADRGYDGAGFIVAAIKAANGNVDDHAAFAKVLHSTTYTGARGPIKLDDTGDVIQNQYIQQVVKTGNGYGFKIIATYPDVSATWDRSRAEINKFPFGTLGGKWVGMTKDQVESLSK
jgi:branched-chain amino acid transport system substrate-binding protein